MFSGRRKDAVHIGIWFVDINCYLSCMKIMRPLRFFVSHFICWWYGAESVKYFKKVRNPYDLVTANQNGCWWESRSSHPEQGECNGQVLPLINSTHYLKHLGHCSNTVEKISLTWYLKNFYRGTTAIVRTRKCPLWADLSCRLCPLLELTPCSKDTFQKDCNGGDLHGKIKSSPTGGILGLRGTRWFWT